MVADAGACSVPGQRCQSRRALGAAWWVGAIGERRRRAGASCYGLRGQVAPFRDGPSSVRGRAISLSLDGSGGDGGVSPVGRSVRRGGWGRSASVDDALWRVAMGCGASCSVPGQTFLRPRDGDLGVFDGSGGDGGVCPVGRSVRRGGWGRSASVDDALWRVAMGCGGKLLRSSGARCGVVGGGDRRALTTRCGASLWASGASCSVPGQTFLRPREGDLAVFDGSGGDGGVCPVGRSVRRGGWERSASVDDALWRVAMGRRGRCSVPGQTFLRPRDSDLAVFRWVGWGTEVSVPSGARCGVVGEGDRRALTTRCGASLWAAGANCSVPGQRCQSRRALGAAWWVGAIGER